MANWYGSSRTNYFRVKDADAFRAAMKDYEIDVWTPHQPDIDEPNMFALGSKTEDGGWPSYDLETDTDFEMIEKVWPHLAEGEVAVFQTIGAEKRRYLTGYAEAVNHKGKRVAVSIEDIYALAKRRFKVEAITRATY
jgi:hypothetical protein